MRTPITLSALVYLLLRTNVAGAVQIRKLEVKKTKQPSSNRQKVPVQRFEAAGFNMSLNNVDPLNEVSALTWQEVTGTYIGVTLTQTLGPELVDAVEVSATLISQNPPFLSGGARALETGNSGRGLQKVQELVFDAEISLDLNHELTFHGDASLDSFLATLELDRYIVQAFNADNDGSYYLYALRSTNDDAFAAVNAVSVTPAQSVTHVKTPSIQRDGPKVGLISGLVIAGAIMVVSNVALLLYRSRRDKRSVTDDSKPQLSSLPEEGKDATSSDIEGVSSDTKSRSRSGTIGGGSSCSDDELYTGGSSCSDDELYTVASLQQILTSTTYNECDEYSVEA